MSRTIWRWGTVVSWVGVAALLVIALLIHADTRPQASVNTPEPTATTSSVPEPSATAEACATTWPIVLSDNSDNRWFADGITEIKSATDEASARTAAHVWLDQVRQDPRLLSGAAKYFLNRDVDPSTLQTGQCASDTAVSLTAEIELSIAEAKVEASEAPATGYNSGVYEGVVVSASEAGISGDRKAIKVTLKDGTVIYVMARCGNPVTPGKPSVPEGPTDEPTPTPTPTPTPKPATDRNCMQNPDMAGCPTNPQSGQPADQNTQAQDDAIAATGGSTHQPSAQDNPGPGAPSAPPTTSAPEGYTPPSGSGAPGGSSSTDDGPPVVNPPAPTPTPTPEPTLGGETHTGDPGEPAG